MLYLPPLAHGEYFPTYCGPSTLRIVGLHYGIDRSVEEWASYCDCIPSEGFPVEGDGCNGKQLLAGARQGGLEGHISDGTSMRDLQRYLREGIPPIVDWFAEDFHFRRSAKYIDTDGCDGHYSAVVHVTRRYVLLRDPRCAELVRFRRPDFERVWFDFRGNHIEKELHNMILRRAIILFPAGRLPAPPRSR